MVSTKAKQQPQALVDVDAGVARAVEPVPALAECDVIAVDVVVVVVAGDVAPSTLAKSTFSVVLGSRPSSPPGANHCWAVFIS